MEGAGTPQFESFKTPQEELEYLRARVKEVEQSYESKQFVPSPEHVVTEAITTYAAQKPEHVLAPVMQMPHAEQQAVMLDLAPETHDEKIADLIELIQTKGILNAIGVVSKMDNPHLADDFHRFLVAYIQEGYPAYGVKEGTPIFRALHRTLFEVSVPDNMRSKGEQSLKEIVSMMEQVYAGILTIGDDSSGNEHFTLEIANPVGRGDFMFYISVPDSKIELFKKQIHSFFPDIVLVEQPNDFNIFTYGGDHALGYMTHTTTPVRMLKTIEQFDTDPLKAMLNVLSNLDTMDEGASIQLIFKPVGSFYEKNYNTAIRKMQEGKSSPQELYVRNTTLSKMYKGVASFANDTSKLFDKKKEDGTEPEKPKVDSSLLEHTQQKVTHPIVSTNLRIAASAKLKTRADAILRDIASAFNQFKLPTGNNLKLQLLEGRSEGTFIYDFSYRTFNDHYDVPLNLAEVATMFHFPGLNDVKNPQLKTQKSMTAPAPLELPQDGIQLGFNEHAGRATPITMSVTDRLRHMYVIGQTGTGKTNFLKSMIIQDIKNGDGVCMIDPHGSDIQDILANIPPERLEDVIYFDPAYVDRPMALNMLEYDVRFPEQKTFVVNELFSIFQKLYGGNPESMGPMFEQYFRNATMLVIEDPETGNTLLDVSRVMSDDAYRKLKLSRCRNPVVVQFWEEIAQKAGGEAALQNIVPYITSKFDVFLANDIMRPVIAQEKSSFNFRQIMDEKKILLVNLSKGRLGDINSSLIGLILVGKILMAALSRVDQPQQGLNPFYLYVDEFQNITTDSIATILSEARKYKLSLHIAHQFIGQLTDSIKNAVFGNVGTLAVFRVGADDAQYLEQQFAPRFTAGDIMNINNFNCYLKMLANGVPQEPFNVATLAAPNGNIDVVQDLKMYSYLKYGRDKALVDAEIMSKYKRRV
jgi:hypothetical protein